MKRWRPESVGGLVQQAVSEVLRGMKDPRIGFVTVTGVDMSDDLRHAKVYVSVLGPEETRQDTLDALEHGSAYIRREVGQRIQIRHTPELLFRYDNSLEHGVKIDKILDGLNSQQSAVSGPPKAEE
jgi:ribosome-binding factor A